MTPRPDIIFIMGSQGSGKGTQGRILAEKLKFFFWDMGAILRQDRDFVLSDGNKIGDIIDRGHYLTTPQIIEVFKRRIHEVPPGQGVIFDGVPRRVGQEEFLLNFFKRQGRENFVTIYLSVPREESLKRLKLRAEKEKRTDDEMLAERFRQHETNTLPILDYLKKNTRFIEIDGSPPVPEVSRKIDEALGLSQ